MPYYNELGPADDFKRRDYELVFPNMALSEKKHTIEKLLVLKQSIRRQHLRLCDLENLEFALVEAMTIHSGVLKN
jgi:hypothetical protein